MRLPVYSAQLPNLGLQSQDRGGLDTAQQAGYRSILERLAPK